MAMYKHLNTGVVAELIAEEGVTVQIKIVDTGETKEIGLATFKRWWKLFQPDVPMDAQEPQNEPEAEEPEEMPVAGPDATAEPVEAQTELDFGEDDDEVEDNEDEDDQNEPRTLQDGPEAERPEETPVTDPDAPVEAETQSAPLTLSDVIKKLEDLFDLLSKLYFDNALTRPVITVQSTPKAYGHCSTKKIWSSGVEGEGESYYEINIGAEHLNRPSENTAATMCHEMIHLYCRENNIKETCQGVRYHTKVFKTEAESRDLEIGYDRAIGYSLTKPTEEFIKKLGAAGYVLEVPFARHTIEKDKAASKRAKAHKYFCGVCKQEVKTTQELNIICGNCNIKMERA